MWTVMDESLTPLLKNDLVLNAVKGPVEKIIPRCKRQIISPFKNHNNKKKEKTKQTTIVDHTARAKGPTKV